jgi:hypothetical protein
MGDTIYRLNDVDHVHLTMVAKSDVTLMVKRNHRKTLSAVFADPVSAKDRLMPSCSRR